MAKHVMGKTINVNKILVRKCQLRHPLVRLRHKWDDDVDTSSSLIGCQGVKDVPVV
jgi:hypothetical protein